MRIFLMTLLLVTCSAAMAQQIYSWRDASGVIHYQDSPPAGDSYQTREMRHNMLPQADASSPEAAKAKAKVAACNRAKANIEVISSNPFVRLDRNGDGDAELLTDAERETELARAKAISEQLCKN